MVFILGIALIVLSHELPELTKKQKKDFKISGGALIVLSSVVFMGVFNEKKKKSRFGSPGSLGGIGGVYSQPSFFNR